MGGWRNWQQNLLNGPPLPAPPSFTGLALAGLAALGLMEDHPRWLTATPTTTSCQTLDEVLERRNAAGDRPALGGAARAALLHRRPNGRPCRRLRPDHAAARDASAGAAACLCRPEDGRRLRDGYRYAELPPQGEAWRRGLAALDAGCSARRMADLSTCSVLPIQDALLSQMQRVSWHGRLGAACPARLFFEHRVIPDITHAYYAHPTAWNEIGFGGPASPRGYVRMGLDRRDPWEAVEARRRWRRPRHGKNAMSADPFAAPRAIDGRAPDVFKRRRLGADAAISRRRGRRFRRRRHRRRRRPADRPARRSAASPSSASTPGPISGRWRILLPTRREQNKLYWTDERIVDGANPITMGGKNSGKAVGGSTVHFAMVSLRFRPEWFKSRSALGLWRRLAARLAGDVALLRRGGEGAEHLRTGDLSLGSETPALPVSRA